MLNLLFNQLSVCVFFLSTHHPYDDSVIHLPSHHYVNLSAKFNWHARDIRDIPIDLNGNYNNLIYQRMYKLVSNIVDFEVHVC